MKSRNAFRPSIESCELENRDLQSGVVAGSYYTGTDYVGPNLNAQLNAYTGWLYVNGHLQLPVSKISGTLTYIPQQGGIYAGTLSISGTQLKMWVQGYVNSLMAYQFTAGSLKGDTGTVAIHFPVTPGPNDYTIDFDAPPHRPLPKFIGGHKPAPVHHPVHH